MRCKNIDTLLLGTPGVLCAWALQGYFSVGHCRDIWWLDTAGILCSWALQKYFAVGHCRYTLRLGTAGILGGWSLNSASSRARTTSTLKSSNPTARVGKKPDKGAFLDFRSSSKRGWAEAVAFHLRILEKLMLLLAMVRRHRGCTWRVKGT